MAGLIDLNGLGHFKAKENAMVADTYSASKTYAVGDYVYYNGTLYRCTTAISTTEAWTAGHWTAAKLGDDCSSLKTAITEKNCSDVLHTFASPVNRTVAGVTFAWSGLTCKVTGTSSDRDWSNILVSTTSLPEAIVAGRTYYLKYNNTNPQLSFNILWYVNGSLLTEWKYYADAVFTVPINATGVSMRLCIYNGYTYNDNVTINIDQSMTNAELTTELKDTENRVNTLVSNAYTDISGVIKKEYTVGSYKNTSGTSVNISSVTTDARYAYCLDACVANDVYYVRGYGVTNSTALWAFLSSDGTILLKSSYPNDTNGDYAKVVAPQNSAYFLSNVYIANGYGLYKENKTYSGINNVLALSLPEDEFVYEIINETTLVHTPSRRNLATVNFLKPYIKSIINTSSDVRVAVFRYDLLGNPLGFEKWITSGVPYYFEHSTYKYILNISYYGGSRAIVNKNDVLKYLKYMVDIDEVVDYHNAIEKTKSELEANVVWLNDTVSVLMSADYNITFANSPSPISLESYVGNNQVMHPKVLYFANGFGGHKYWMAYTPYPMSIDAYENPCIAWSDDGYAWINIVGNPLDDPNGVGYNSDTHLVYNPTTEKLECWYRYVSNTSPVQEIIKRKISSDGVTWGDAETILTDSTGGANKLLSPSVITDGTTYQMWVVDGGLSKINYYTASASAITTWTLVRSITLTYSDGTVSNYSPWHLDVIITSDNKYLMCVMCRVTNGRWSLFLTTSTDNTNYDTPYPVILPSSRWDKFMYRSSIVQIDNVNRIYYSACGSDLEGGGNIWGIGITESNTLTNFIGKSIT